VTKERPTITIGEIMVSMYSYMEDHIRERLVTDVVNEISEIFEKRGLTIGEGIIAAITLLEIAATEQEMLAIEEGETHARN